MVARIDCSLNVCPTTDQFGVTHSVAGSVTVELTAGRYMTLSALCAQIQTQLQASVHASFTCVESAGVVTIACSTGTFSLTWTRPALRDFLGWSADIGAGTSSASGSQSPGVFISSHPFYGDALGWEWSLKLRTDHRGGGSGYRLGKDTIWSTTAQMIDESDRAQWLKVARRLLKGEPFTWFRDSTNTTAWAYTNWYGKVEAVLHPETRDVVDRWLTAPHLTAFDVPLMLRVYTASNTATVSDWETLIASDAVVGLRWYAKIGGIGHIFLDSPATPVGPNGNSWATPVSGGENYTISANTLDVSGGVRDAGSEIDRRTGVVTSRGMQITLKDEDGGTTINDLLAYEKSGGLTAIVTDDVDYDTGGTGSVFTVDDTTSWDSSGLAYFGPETISYPAKAATTLGTAGNKATRGVFDLSDADRVYTHEPDRIGAAVTVTDYPATWHGRWVSLYCYAVCVDGYAYDSTFDGSYSREVYRGIVQGDPMASDDWGRWTLNTRSIDSLLNTEVGGEYRRGTMLRFPGTFKQNEEGAATVDEYKQGNAFSYYIDESTGSIDMTVVEYSNTTDFGNGTVNSKAAITATVASAGQLVSVYGLQVLIQQALSTALVAEYGSDPDLVIFPVWRKQGGGWGFDARARSGKVFEVTMHLGASNSIGPLIGYDSDVSGIVQTTSETLIATKQSSGPVGLYISPTAMTIPFYYTLDGGQLEDPPSSGFARVGGEIVEYESITATSVKDLYQLDVTKRGALGTQPMEHIVPITHDGHVSGNSVEGGESEIVFGVGFDAVNPIHALLQLATSTGSGHHGTYDTLGANVAVPINPNHFDTAAFERHADQLVGLQKTINLFLSKPIRLSQLAADLLTPFGRYIHATSTSSGFLITVGEHLPALESETSDYTVDSSNTAMVDPAVFRNGSDRVVTHVKVAWRWSVTDEKPTEDRATIVNRPAVVRYGARETLEWTLIGQPKISFGEVVGYLQNWAQEVFERHGKPFTVAQITVDRTGWLLEPGDTIAFTLADAPTPTGTRGYSSHKAVVLQVGKRYQGGDTSVYSPGADLVVVIQPQGRASTYSPAAQIASYDSGAPSVTLTANAFTPASGSAVDADHFDNGDLVRIFNAGDEPGDSVTLSGKTGNTFTISTTLTITPGANTYMVARDYNAVQATQKEHVFIADNSTPPVLSVSDTETFVYV